MGDKKNAKLISVRFPEQAQADIETIAKRLGLSLTTAVVFLTCYAIDDIRKNKRTWVETTIATSEHGRLSSEEQEATKKTGQLLD